MHGWKQRVTVNASRFTTLPASNLFFFTVQRNGVECSYCKALERERERERKRKDTNHIAAKSLT